MIVREVMAYELVNYHTPGDRLEIFILYLTFTFIFLIIYTPNDVRKYTDKQQELLDLRKKKPRIDHD